MKTIRLLMLEDSPDDALLIEESLRDYGLEIDTERVCDEAGLRRLLRERWDAVLSDYSMPGLRAEEALAIVRAQDAELPFILISGTVDPRIAVDMMRGGMHEYVLKDDLERLPPALEREIRDAAHRRNEKLARAELFALQKQFRDTIEQSSVGVLNLDRGMHVFRANTQASRMLGYSPEELLGRSCDDLTWPDDLPAAHARQERLLRGEINEYSAEKRYRREDGTPLWALLTLTAIRDEYGEISYLSAIIQDLTEKKAAEERVVRSEQFIRAVLDSFPFQTAVIDREGTIRMVNTAWEGFALTNGLEDLESIGVGAPYFDVCPDELRDQLSRVACGETEISLEYPCHSPDEERWFLMKAAPLASPDGGAVVTHVDITARVIAEHDLERREREYRTILDTMGEGLYTLDPENRITYANPRFCKMVGYELSELVEQDVIELLAYDEDRDRIKEMSERRLRGFMDRYDSRMKHKDGHEVLIEMNAVPRFDAEGRILGKLCVANDVTETTLARREQERMRSQIEEMNRIESLGQLAGTMAHEFNNVLMGIQPFADVIQRSVDESNERVLSATKFIMDSVNRGRRISQEVLRFARPVPPTRTRMSVKALVRDVEEVCRSVLDGGYHLDAECLSEHEISIDREQILQVFSNLTINARDASPRGTTITIRGDVDPVDTRFEFGIVEHPERFVHLTVTDQGSGIPKEKLKAVFEPMFTTKRSGTGLGLAVTYQIVTLHGGMVFAESNPGQGTSIHIFLPYESETQSPITQAVAVS